MTEWGNLMNCGSKDIFKKIYPVSCTNTYHDVTDLVNHGIVKKTKTVISCERNITFLRNKKFFQKLLFCRGRNL